MIIDRYERSLIQFSTNIKERTLFGIACTFVGLKKEKEEEKKKLLYA